MSDTWMDSLAATMDDAVTKMVGHEPLAGLSRAFVVVLIQSALSGVAEPRPPSQDLAVPAPPDPVSASAP